MGARTIMQVAATGGDFDSDRILRSPCGEIVLFDESVGMIAEDLVATMAVQPLAVGLAAPQIGVPRRVAAVRVSAEEPPLIVVNPEVLVESGKKDVKRESCMSVWGMAAPVERRSKVLLRFQDIYGATYERQFSGFAARVVLHEVDHLNGVLYLDRSVGPSTETDIFVPYAP